MKSQHSTGKGGETVLEAIKAIPPSIATVRGLTGAQLRESCVQPSSSQGSMPGQGRAG